MTPTRTCADCATPCVPTYRWRQATPDQRQAAVDAGVRKFVARGLCGLCYSRRREAGTLLDRERRNRPMGETLDEWQHLADPNLPIRGQVRQLAPRLGMSPKGLENAVRRAGVRSQYVGGWGMVRKDGATA